MVLLVNSGNHLLKYTTFCTYCYIKLLGIQNHFTWIFRIKQTFLLFYSQKKIVNKKSSLRNFTPFVRQCIKNQGILVPFYTLNSFVEMFENAVVEDKKQNKWCYMLKNLQFKKIMLTLFLKKSQPYFHFYLA